MTAVVHKISAGATFCRLKKVSVEAEVLGNYIYVRSQ